MKLITNIQPPFLTDILLKQSKDLKEIKAAVAYCKDYKLFEYCKQNKIKLDYYGRLDDSINLDLKKLKSFLTDNISIRIIGGTKFHPKVIWYYNYGAYIGSANLTQSAWEKNIECGLWLDQKELKDNNLTALLDDFFEYVEKESHPLSKIPNSKIEQINKHKPQSQFNKKNLQLLEKLGIPVFPGCSNNRSSYSLDSESHSSERGNLQEKFQNSNRKQGIQFEGEGIMKNLEEKILAVDSSIEHHPTDSYAAYGIKPAYRKGRQFIRFYKKTNKMTMALPFNKIPKNVIADYDLKDNSSRVPHELPTKGARLSDKYLEPDFIDLIEKSFRLKQKRLNL